MIAEIKTEHGNMKVDLDAFLPTGKARIRKLFRLMQQGMGPEERCQVREYLKSRKEYAAHMQAEGERMARTLEKELADTESSLEKLQERKRQLKERMRETERDIRAAGTIEEMSPVWIREFDYICGDPESRA